MKFEKKEIKSKNSPAPIGPYSQAVFVKSENLLFISGQIPFDLKKGEMISDISEATKLVMQYLEEILKEANMNFNNVIKSSIFLMDMKDFPIVNEVYGSYFKNSGVFPARETIQVAGLPKGACVEISMIAAQ